MDVKLVYQIRKLGWSGGKEEILETVLGHDEAWKRAWELDRLDQWSSYRAVRDNSLGVIQVGDQIWWSNSANTPEVVRVVSKEATKAVVLDGKGKQHKVAYHNLRWHI